MNPLISIIIPVFNVEKYLNRCIESVLTQTYDNIEIILIDDGSVDFSPKICDSYKEKDKRIIVIHKQNGGLSDARNCGLKVSTGEFICFVDSDDYLESDFVEKLYNAILISNADLAICNFKYVDVNCNGLWKGRSPIINDVFDKEQLLSKICDTSGYYYVVAWNKLYSRKALNNIMFPLGKTHEDEFIIHRIVDNCEKIVSIAKPLYNYLQRSGSIMNQDISIKRLDYIEALANRIDFFISINQTKFIDFVIKSLISFYFQWRRCFIKSNQERLKELDELVKRSIKSSKPYVRSIKTKVLLFFPSFTPRFLKIKHFCIKRKFPFLIFRVFAWIKREKKRRLFAKKQKLHNCFGSGVKALFLDTPTHGNLGDHAICESEKDLIKTIYEGAVLEYTHDEWNLNKKYIISNLPKDVVVFLPGGGFIGSLWPNEHKTIISILRAAKENKIIIFPQTIYFDLNNKKLITDFVSTCKDCEFLCVMVRDKNSYDLMNRLGLSGICRYIPDAVLTYNCNLTNTVESRKDILLCLREDKEKSTNVVDIEKVLIDSLLRFDRTSTVLNVLINPSERKTYIDEKITEFSRYELVITDRLHAMLFSLLAGTPCLALDNSSKKVSGVYEWIKAIDGIACVEPTEINYGLVREYMAKKVSQLDQKVFLDMLLNVLKECDFDE